MSDHDGGFGLDEAALRREIEPGSTIAAGEDTTAAVVELPFA